MLLRKTRRVGELVALVTLFTACASPKATPPSGSGSESTGRASGDAQASVADTRDGASEGSSGAHEDVGSTPATTGTEASSTTGIRGDGTTGDTSGTSLVDPGTTVTSGYDGATVTSAADEATETQGSEDTSSPFPDDVTRPRLMIVGDSISAGPGCYKGHLLALLMENGHSSFEFVGPYDDDCGGGVRHGAVSCSTAEQYTNAMFTMPNCAQGMSFAGMSTLVATHEPDLVMLQLGVNDLWGGRTPEAILASYTTLLQQARALNPNIVMVVAQINKIRPDCTNEAVTVAAQSLVDAIPEWAAMLSTRESPVFVADLWTNSDWSMAETLDCVHPNDLGAEKMARHWYDALKDILPG